MASIGVTLQTDLLKAIRFTETVARQLPFATSQALNDTGFSMREALNASTRQYFDRPVPFTQRAFLVERSSKRNLEVTVYAEQRRDLYLRTHLAGGTRGQKPFERKLLQAAPSRIPSASRLVPAPGIKLTSAGNVSLATIQRVSRQMATKGKNSVFAGTPRGGNRLPGFYQRKTGRKGATFLTPLFLAVDNASYTARFPIGEISQKVIDRRFNGYLTSRLQAALATAR